MTLYRCIGLNPVRTVMVDRPELHHWSSIHANVGLEPDDLVTPNPAYLALDPDPVIRALAYQAWLQAAIGSEELTNIRQHLLGDIKFRAMGDKALGHHASLRPPGRPKRVEDDS